MTPAQLRMARAGLRISVRELADLAGVTANTVSRYENGKDAMASTVQSMKRALELAGAVFLTENGVRVQSS